VAPARRCSQRHIHTYPLQESPRRGTVRTLSPSQGTRTDKLFFASSTCRAMATRTFAHFLFKKDQEEQVKASKARHTHRHSPLSRVATCRALTKRHFLLLSPRRTKERDSYENAETRRQRSFKAPALSIPLLRVAPAKPWSETHCTDSRSPRRPKGNSSMAITGPAASQATRVSTPRHIRRPSPPSGVAKCRTMVRETPYAPDFPRINKESGTRTYAWPFRQPGQRSHYDWQLQRLL
jgi:hypothetical protein